MTVSEVVLIRHGQTEWSVSGQHTGRTDIALTELGRRQADALSQMLSDEPFDAVLSSPLARAWETMERAGLGREAIAVDDLMEWDYGVFEGRRTDDIQKEIPDWSIWSHPVPNGESLAEVAARADRVIEKLLAIEGRVAVFAHGHMLRILGVRWVEMPPDTARHFRLDTATICTLSWARENRVIRQWNESCHLRSLDPLL
ncbi:MAG: histidine phosphatase family protein [Myxococcota bacterium]